MIRHFASFDELKVTLTALSADEQLMEVLLTPELATDILAHDPVNRKIRHGNLSKIEREIQGGHWDPKKSSSLKFLPSCRLADGQHRCRAVVGTGTPIIVSICVVEDTLGVDEGAARTLADHLQLSHGLDEARATLAAIVTKALCSIKSPNNREYLDFYRQNEAFIKECADKPIEWLKDQIPAIAVVFKPQIVATMRARAIFEKNEPAESVDQLFSDAINGGETAPDGSRRRALAKQLFEALQAAFSGKKTKRQDMLKWVLVALKCERDGVIRNITTARGPSDKKKRRAKKQSISVVSTELSSGQLPMQNF